MRPALLIAAAAAALAAASAASAAPVPSCRTAEIRQHDEVVFGHFPTRSAAAPTVRAAKRWSFKGIKVEDDGCGDFEVEIDGADTAQQRTSFAAEAAHAGFHITFEQTGEPMQPPQGEVVGVFASFPRIARANKLAWKLADASFRYIDIVPSGARWLVVMPQVPVKSALSIAKEVANAGFHIQFRNAGK